MPEVLEHQDWAEVGRTSWVAAAEEAGCRFVSVITSAADIVEPGTFGSVVDEQGERLVLRFRDDDAQVVAEPATASTP